METKKGCGCGSKPLSTPAGRPGNSDVRDFLERRVRQASRGYRAQARTIDEIVTDTFDADRPAVSRIENIRAPGPNGTALPPLY